MAISGTTTPKVLVVVASNDRRGGEVSGSTLAREMRRFGVMSEVVALAPGSGRVPLDVVTIGPRAKSIRTYRELRRRARDFDVVIAYGSSSLPAAAISLIGTGVPFIYRSIGDPLEWSGGRMHRARTALLFSRAAGVVTLFHGAAQSMTKLYRVQPERLSVIGNARSPIVGSFDSSARDSVRSELGLAADQPVVVFVGSLSEEKRVHLAISAVGSMPGVTLLVVGSGPLRDELEAGVSAEARERVKFLGQRDDVSRLLRAADVLVLPSRTEGMPGVIIEAGVQGIPAVAADVGAVSEMIEDGVSGRVVRPGEVHALVEGLTDALEHSVMFGAASREIVRSRFTWDTVVPKWIEVLTNVARTAR